MPVQAARATGLGANTTRQANKEWSRQCSVAGLWHIAPSVLPSSCGRRRRGREVRTAHRLRAEGCGLRTAGLARPRWVLVEKRVGASITVSDLGGNRPSAKRRLLSAEGIGVTGNGKRCCGVIRRQDLWVASCPWRRGGWRLRRGGVECWTGEESGEGANMSIAVRAGATAAIFGHSWRGGETNKSTHTSFAAHAGAVAGTLGAGEAGSRGNAPGRASKLIQAPWRCVPVVWRWCGGGLHGTGSRGVESRRWRVA